MKRLVGVVAGMLVAVNAWASDIIILDVMPRGNNPLYQSMIEYVIALGRAAGKFLGVL